MFKLRGKNAVVKAFSATLTAVMMTTLVAPEINVIRVMAAERNNQFNVNMAGITEQKELQLVTTQGSNVSRSSGSIKFTGNDSSANFDLEFSDNYLLAAIDSGVKVPFEFSFEGIVSSLPVDGSIELKVDVRFGKEGEYAEDNAPVSSIIHILADGNFAIGNSIDIPKETRSAFVTITPTFVNADGSTLEVKKSEVKVVDDARPQISYEAETTAPTNTEYTVKVIAEDNIGVQGIYDKEGNLVSSNTGKKVTFDININSDESVTYEYYAIDYAGHQTLKNLVFTIDNYDSKTPGDFTGSINTSDWTNIAPVITLDEIQQDSGSTIKYYVKEGELEEQAIDGNTYTVKNEGNSTVVVTIGDEAGNRNSNTQNFTYKFDKTAPEVTSEPISQADGTTKVVINAQDALSGVAKVYYVLEKVSASDFTQEKLSDFTEITATEKSFVMEKAGNYTVYVVDVAGNYKIINGAATVKPVIFPTEDINVAGGKNTFTMKEDKEDGKDTFKLTISDDSKPEDLTVTATFDSSYNDVINPIEITNSDKTYSFKVTPKADKFNETGIPVTITVEDPDNNTESITVYIIIEPVNDPPRIVVENKTHIVKTKENQAVTFNPTTDEFGKDYDVEGDTLVVASDLQLSNENAGKLTLDGNEFKFVPEKNWYGKVTFTYTVTDGKSDPVQGKYEIEVTNINDKPIAKNDSAETEEDTPISINVLKNDTDPDMIPGSTEKIRISEVDGKVISTGETITLASGNGTVKLQENGELLVTPTLDFNGTITFTYKISDIEGASDTATVTVKVEAVNDAPEIVEYPNDSKIPDKEMPEDPEENEKLKLTFTVKDVDTNISDLVINVTSSDGNLIKNDKIQILRDTEHPEKVTIIAEPVKDESGKAELSIKVSDGINTIEKIVKVTVTPRNDDPVAAPDDMTKVWNVFEGQPFDIAKYFEAILANDSDIDNDTIFVSDIKVTTAAAGSVSVNKDTNGKVTKAVYTSPAEFTGDVVLNYTISDGNGGTASSTITIHVDEVDDAPVITYAGTTEALTIDEDDVNKPLEFVISDSDTDINKLTVVYESNNPQLISNNQISSDGIVTIDEKSGKLVLLITPTAQKSGTADIKITVSDGTSSTSFTQRITVRPVQDPPVAEDDRYDRIYGGTGIYFIPTNNDHDLDDEPLSVAKDSEGNYRIDTPSVGSIVPYGDGIGFVYFAPSDVQEDGLEVKVKYYVTDGKDTDDAEITFVLYKRPENLPVINCDDPFSFRYNETSPEHVFTVNKIDKDENNKGTVSVAFTSLVDLDGDGTPESNAILESISVKRNADGTFSLIPKVRKGVTGGRTVVEITADNGQYRTRQYITVFVHDKNDIPTIVNHTYSIEKEGQKFTITKEMLLEDAEDKNKDPISLYNLSISSCKSGLAEVTVIKDPTTGEITGYEFNPHYGYFYGTVTLSYTVTDGIDVSTPKTVTLVYPNKDSKPVARADSFIANKNEAGGSGSITVASMLSNDYDVDNDFGTEFDAATKAKIYFITYSDRTTESGRLSAADYGTLTYDPINKSFTYVRNQKVDNAHGDVYFDYWISNNPDPRNEDGSIDYSQCVKSTVHIYESYPHLWLGHSVGYVTKEDVDYNGTITVGHQDYDGPVRITYTITNDASDIGEFKYTEILENTYTSNFTFDVKDNANGTVRFNISVEAVKKDEQGNWVTDTDCEGTMRSDSIYVVPVNDVPTIKLVDAKDDKNQFQPTGEVGKTEPWKIDEDGSMKFTFVYEDAETEPLALDFSAVVKNYDINGEKTDEPVVTVGNISITKEKFTDESGTHCRAIVTMPTISNMSGQVEITFTVSDGEAKKQIVTKGIINPVDDPPEVKNIEVTTEEDTEVMINLAEVVYDVDTEAKDLIYYAILDPENAHGEIISFDQAKGVLTYRPNTNYYGTDTFKYAVGYTADKDKDGNEKYQSIATVKVNIEPVNDDPIVYDWSISAVGKEDQVLKIPFKCTDPEDKNLKFEFKNYNDNLIESVEVVRDDSPDAGANDYILVVTPKQDKYGSTDITLVVTDNNTPTAGKTEKKISVAFNSENDVPKLENDEATLNEKTAKQDSSVEIEVLNNDYDIETAKNDLIISVNSMPSSGAKIQVIRKANAPDTIRYTPALNWNGTETFEYNVIDADGGVSTATVTVTVNPVNTRPTIIDHEKTIDERSSCEIDPLVGAVDVEVNGGGSYDENQKLELIPSSVEIVTEGGAYGTVEVKNGKIIYKETKEVGSGPKVEKIKYNVTDGIQQAEKDAYIYITILPISDPPMGLDPAKNDSEISVEYTKWELNEDPENPAEESTFYIKLDDPDTDLSKLIVTVKLSDTTIIKNSGVKVENYYDEDGKLLGKKVTLTPIENQNGELSATIVISDGTSAPEYEVPIVVKPVNDKPEFTDKTKETVLEGVQEYETDEEVAVSDTYSATDVEDKTEDLTFSVRKLPDAKAGTVTIDANGKWTFTPKANFHGTATFTLRVTDNAETNKKNPDLKDTTVKYDEIEVSIKVNNINDAPVAKPIEITVEESSTGNVIDLKNIKDTNGNYYFSDPDISTPGETTDAITGEELTISRVGFKDESVTKDSSVVTEEGKEDNGFSRNGSATISGFTIVYTPALYDNHEETFTYEITDKAGKTSISTIHVTIVPKDDVPSDGNDSYEINEDCGWKEYDVLINDNDPDILDKYTQEQYRQTLLLKYVTYGGQTIYADKPVEILKTAHGEVKIENGKLYYRPDDNFYNSKGNNYTQNEVFTYGMTDTFDGSELNSVEFTVEFKVKSVNDIPTITTVGTTTTVDEGAEVVINGTVDDVETPKTGDNGLKVTATSSNKHLIPDGAIVVSGPNADGKYTVTCTPTAHANGETIITIMVDDREGGTANTTYKIIIREVDDVPNPDVQEAETDENTPKIVDVLFQDDPDLNYGNGDQNLTIVEGSVKAPKNFTGTFEVVDYTTVDKYYDKDGNYVDRSESVTRKAIKITPDSNWTSSEDVTYEFTYEAIDNNNDKKPGLLKFTVKAVNDAPVFGDRLDNTKDKSTAVNSDFAKNGAIYEDMESEASTPNATVICSDPNGVAVYVIHVDDEETPKKDLSVSIESISPNKSSTTELLLDASKTKIIQNSDGTWTLYAVPVKNQNGGEAKVNLCVSDGDKYSEYSVIVKVNPKEDAPEGGDDEYTIDEDSGEHKFEVTINDDIDITTNNEGIKVISVTPIDAHAKTLKIDPDNDKLIIYEPEKDYYNDEDHKATFQYVVEDDAGNQQTFTVRVEVKPVNDPPKIEVIANGAGKISTVERIPFTEFTVIVSDVDDPTVKGANAKGVLVLTATNEGARSLIRNDAIKISDPEAEMEEGQPTGRYIYKVNITPNKAYNGETTIKFTVKDPSKASDSKTVLANVGFKNDAPYFFDGKAKVDMVFDEGPDKRIIDVTNCYYDEDLDTNPMSSADPKGEQLYISSWEFTEEWMNKVGSLYIVDKNGNEVTSANKVDGVKLAYKVNAGYEDFNGILKFKYTVSDTIGSPEKMNTDQYSVTSDVCSITINQINDTPKAENYTSTVNEDDENIVLKKTNDTVIRIAEDNTDKDFYDNEVDGIKVNQDKRAPYDSDEKLTVTKIVGDKGGTVTYDATKDEVIYTPKAHYNGLETLTFTVEDSHGGKTTGTIKITVVSKNDAPDAQPDEVTIVENEEILIDVIKGVPESTGKDTEPYDSDKNLNEGQSATEESNNTTLTVVGVYQKEDEAVAAAVDSNSTFQESFTTTHNGKVEIKNNKVNYIPGKDYNGDDVVYYVVANKNANENKYSVAKIDIHVTSVNNKPVITDSESKTDENTNIAIPSILEDHDAIVVNIFDSASFVEGNKPDTSAVNHTGNKIVRITDQDRNHDNGLLPVATNDDVRFKFAIETVEAIKPDGSVKTIDDITKAYYRSLLAVDQDTGIMTFTPGKDFNGTLKFKYSVSDGTDKAYGYVTFEVKSVNDAPVAKADSVETPEDKAIKIDVVAGVPTSTGKDTDVDASEILNLGETDEVKSQNSTIKVVGVYQTESEANAKAVDSNSSFSTEFTTTHSGTVKITGDHEVTYTPAANYNGSDEFYYVVGNVAAGENKYSVAKVTVTVKAENDAPIIRDVTATPNLENENTEVKVNVFDEDKGPVTVNIFNQATLVGANKTTATNLYGTDKKVNIVDYDRQMDNALLGESTTNNIQFKFAKVSVEAFNANGEKVTTNNAKYLGYLTVNETTGDMTFTPDANFNGTLKYKYSVSDGDDKAYGYVTFEVKSVNDAPVANDDQTETKEDAEAIDIDVLKNDKDVDRDSPELNLGQTGTDNTDLKVIAVFKTEQEAKDAFAGDAIPSNTGCVAVYGGTVVTDGTKVTYKPVANFNGVDEFYYVVGNKDAGTDKSNKEVSIAKVTVLVLSVNDAPIAAADSAETNEDESVTIDVINGDSEGNGKDTEPNDSDNDINKNQQATDKNTELTVVAVYKTEQEAKEAVNAAIADAQNYNKTKLSLDNKTCTTANGATVTISENTVTYKPADNFNGNDAFFYVVANKDSAENNFSLKSIAKVEVKVNSVNDAPDAKADKYDEADRFKTEDCYAITTEDQKTPIEIDVLKNDEDVDTKDALNGGQNAIDGEKTKNTSLTIVGVYKTEAEAKNALNSTTTECESEFHGTVKTDGTKVTYVPIENFNGEDTFYYVVANTSATTGEKCDAGSIAKVTVFVRSVNDAPRAFDDEYTVSEDSTDNRLGVITNGNGKDYDSVDTNDTINKGQQAAGEKAVNTELTVIAVYATREEAETAVKNAIAGNTSLSKTSCTTANGSVSIYGSTKNNTVKYIPAKNFNGTDSFFYVVANKDAKENKFSLDSIAKVTVTVKAVNDAPIIRDVTENPNLENLKTEVKVNAFKEDEGPVTVNIFYQATLVGANKTTATNLYGTDKKVNIVDYDRQMDNALLGESTTNNIQFKFAKESVEAFNANGEKVTTNNAKYLGYLTVNETTGDMTFTPDDNFNGTLKYKYSVSDGIAKAYGYVTFEVKSVNDAPVAKDDHAETEEDKSVVIDVIGGSTTGAVKDEEPIDGDTTLNLGQTGTANTDLTVVGVYASEEKANAAANGTQFVDSFTTEKGGKVEISENKIKYTPKKDFHGDDYFYYVVGNVAADENKYSVARVDVKVTPVNDQPVFDSTTPKTAEMNETNANTPAAEQTLTIDIGSHASDVDTSTASDILKFTIDGQDVASEGHYEASIDANGVLKFKPLNGFNGVVNLTIKVDDQQNKENSTNTTVIKITVKSVNNAPVANNDKAETEEEKSVVIDVIGGSTTGAVKDEEPVDGDSTLNRGQTGTANKDITVIAVFKTYELAKQAVESGLLLADEPTSLMDGQIEVVGSGPNNKIRYTPADNYYGEDSFWYVVANVNATENQLSLDSIAEVKITVSPKNDAPIFLDKDGNKVDKPEITVSAIDEGSEKIVVNIFDSESFVEEDKPDTSSVNKNVADKLTIVDYDRHHDNDLITDDQKFTFSIKAVTVIDTNGNEKTSVDPDFIAEYMTYISIGEKTGIITFNPDENFNGTLKYEFSVSDQVEESTGYVIFTVNSKNDVPVAVDDKASVDEDNDIDIDVIGGTTEGAEADTDEFDTSDKLSQGQSESVKTKNTKITIIGVYASEDDAKKAIDDGSFATSNDTAYGHISTDGETVNYKPIDNFNGSETFYYVIANANASENKYSYDSIGKVEVTVNAKDDNPVAGADTANTLEDEAVTINVLENDTDIDSDDTLNKNPDKTPLFVVENGFEGLETGATASVDADGNVLYTPAPGFYGKDVFTYTVSDANGNTSKGEVTVTVIKSDYSIMAEPDRESFGTTRDEDVDVPEPITITVTNVGNKPVDVIEPSLENYEIDGTFPTKLNPAESFTFTIVPKADLPTGDHSGDLEINTVQGTSTTVAIDYQVLALYTLTTKVLTKGGTASFVGDMDIEGSESYVITFKPNKGYRVKKIIVNGKSIGRVSKYEIVNPTMSYTIEIQFERKPGSIPSTGETTDWGRNAFAVLLILGSVVLLKARKKNEEEED